MDGLKRRNSPFSPFLEKFDAEILLSLYRRGKAVESFSGETAMPDLFSLERVHHTGAAVTCQSCIHRLDVTLWS